MSGHIVKVVAVSWSVGMDQPSLASKMNDTIRRESLLVCVGVERVTEWQWLMLFAPLVGGA